MSFRACFAFFVGVEMGLREEFKALLKTDDALNAILTGGIEDAQDRPQDGGGQGSVPRESDGVTILPHAVIRWGPDTEYPPIQIGAELGTVEVYLYQDTGYDAIEAAISRMKSLLNHRYMQVDDREFVHVRQIFVSGETVADELGGAPTRFVRYAVVHVRN